MRPGLPVVACLGWALLLAGPVEGQRRGEGGTAPWAGWRPVVGSAVVPGLGQFELGQRRGWVYLALEVAMWAGYGTSRHAGLEDRSAYRDLAWREARGGVEPRRDGDFEYFERLGAWTRSGAFDADPETAGLQPEMDPRTFNGDAWALARDLVGLPPGAGPEDPRYAQALELYGERAYPGDLLWDWTGSPEARERYRALMKESDDHLRRSTVILGGVFLNHVVAAVDAYVSQASGSALRLEVQPGRRGPEFVPFLTLRVFLP